MLAPRGELLFVFPLSGGAGFGSDMLVPIIFRIFRKAIFPLIPLFIAQIVNGFAVFGECNFGLNSEQKLYETHS
jgi:hypothetical protein